MTQPKPPVVLVVLGPTASGKTNLLMETFGQASPSRPREAELVSADSMQAYRGMDIGTAKPSLAERANLPHHLIDIMDPREQYGVGDFVRLADAACADIVARGRLPIVAGGTGFYVRNFLFGLPAGPEADPEVRAEVARDLELKGPEALRAELEAREAGSSARIRGLDHYRLCRAVEIQRQTGLPPSTFAPTGKLRTLWDFRLISLTRPRPELYARIDARVEAMFEAGLAQEVEGLLALGLGAKDPGFKAIGYSEFLDPEAGGGADPRAWRLEAIKARIQQDTRRYAKRQETFFRGLPGLVAVPASDGEAFLGALGSRIRP